MGARRIPIAERFWPKVNKDGPLHPYRPELGCCWIWTASISRHGYGKIGAGGGGNGHDKAHRVSWRLANGDIPDGLNVLHSCDRRACVNPSHLFLGTNADNTDDMVSKGRHAGPRSGVRGERHGNAKLSAADVAVIRGRLAKGERHGEIAADFGVIRPTISHISRGLTWTNA